MLPENFSNDYCFGGGHPTNFQMVDWMYDPQIGRATISRERFIEEYGDKRIMETEKSLQEFKDELIPFLQGKNYMLKGRKYLFLHDCGASLIFDAPQALKQFQD